MKKILLSLVALLLITTACSSSSNDETSCTSDQDQIYFITDQGGIDDKSFNQSTWEGVLRAVEGTEACGKYLTSETDADYLPNLNSATAVNPELVIAAGFLLEKPIIEVAKTNTEQQYLYIDGLAEENGVQLPNVVSAQFKEHEGSFLVGVAAAEKAKADGYTAVGFIGGMEGDLITKFEVGYIAGVHSVDPEMTVFVSYVGDFSSADIAKIEAEKMYSDGAYVIYHASGGAGNGLIAAAKEKHQDGETVWVIGVDRDQYDDGLMDDGSSVMLTSMVKRVDVVADEMSTKALNGEYYGGEVLIFGLENEGVGIPAENPNLSPEIVASVEAAKQSILSGEIEVPFTK